MNLDSIRETFLVESDEILVSIEKALLTLEENPTDQNEINSLFRAVHTLKGAAGMFGFQKTVDFAHHLETWLDALRSGDVKLDSQKISALLHAHDQISELVNIEARKGENVPPGLIQNGQEILASLTGDATQPERNSDSTELEEDEKIHGIWKIEISLKPDILKHGLDPLSFIRYLGRFGEIRNLTVDHSRLDLDSFDPQLCYLRFQIDFEGNISKSELLDVFDFMLSESEIKIEPPARIIKNSEPETSLLQSNTKATVTKSTGQENQKRFIRIEATKLDMLIDLVGELVIAGATIRQQADHHKLGDIQESAGAMSRLIEDLRDNVMSVRMVQIGETFRKFERIIRDASKELNKDIQMLIEGGDTELDKNLIENISDPLLHLIRNAIDHGIEKPEQRIVLGKDSKATIRLNAYHDTGSIVIEISDDGRGLDKEKILQKARANQLISTNAQLTDHDIYQLIFEPGLSTAESITNISGRGVGMDVVRKNIENMRGSIELETTPQAGTTFRIRLPLTLAIIDGFLVSVRSNFYVVPLDMVIECVELSLNDLSGGGDFLNLRGEVLPFLRLDEFFAEESEKPEKQSVIVVKQGQAKAGLVVDTLEGESQTVIKPLGKIFDNLLGISGATILGSGDVALILDVPRLIETAIQKKSASNV